MGRVLRRRTGALCFVLAAGSLGLAPPAPAYAADVRWRPAPGLSWQWQLTGRVDTSVAARVFDVDLFATRAATVAELRAQGKRVICYMSAGAWERWRPDAERFPRRLLGRSNGWDGERWLDIRRLDLLAPILRDRLDRCARKGFDGVEFDNVDGYANRTGFPLTGSDQLRFNRWLADAAHRRGLAAGLKNDLGQIDQLEPFFDFAINEECFYYRECGKLRRFIAAGKPVFHVEYELRRDRFCSRADDLGFSSMRKGWDLGRWRRPCW